MLSLFLLIFNSLIYQLLRVHLKGYACSQPRFQNFGRAVGATKIVHTGIAGWPIPEAWVLTPIARLRKKFLFINVESAFWRLTPGLPASLKAQIRAYITEQVNRWCVNTGDVAIFTQDQYRHSLLTRHPEQGYVINASWIDEQVIISEAEASQLWHQKLSSYGGELKVLFAGRLIADKGVLVLLKAMAMLNSQSVPIQLDILGEGALLEACEQASQNSQPPVKIQLLGTVEYGAKFFTLLRDYHAIVVPSLSDEQPRIIYDAYSQGIPVLASNTHGIRDCVKDGETGKFMPLNDSSALANLLQWASENPDQLAKMGLNSLKMAFNLTHQEMHRQRWKILLERLETHDISAASLN